MVGTRRGRKRKEGKRYPGGQLVRDKQPSPAEIAASMPHRMAIAIEKRHDPMGECPIGRMCLAGFITADQYDAAHKFRTTVAKYRAVIDSPRDAPNILAKSYTIEAEVEVPAGGGDGVIVTDGGRFGGYGLYLPPVLPRAAPACSAWTARRSRTRASTIPRRSF